MLGVSCHKKIGNLWSVVHVSHFPHSWEQIPQLVHMWLDLTKAGLNM